MIASSGKFSNRKSGNKAVNVSPTGTPLSQASTAPGTPMFWIQTDLEDANRSSPRKFKAMMKQTMSHASTTVAEDALYDSDDEIGIDREASLMRSNEYGQLIDEDGTAWVEVSGTGVKKQKEEYHGRLESLEKSLQDVKGLFRAKTGQDVDQEDFGELASQANTPTARQAKRMRLGPQQDSVAPHLMRASPTHVFSAQEPSCVDDEGTLWTAIRGEGALKPHNQYMAKLSNLEKSLAECKVLYKKKTGVDVDEDDAFMCDDDGTLWISVTGQGAHRPRHSYLTRVEDLQDQLGEAKLLFKNRYGHDIDVEDQDGALLFVKRSSSMSTSGSPKGSPKYCSDLQVPASPARRAERLRAAVPALDSDGRVMELKSGGAVFLPCQWLQAQGNLMKRSLKEDHVTIKALQLAHAACRAEESLAAGVVCAVDSNGCLHGPLSITAQRGLSTAARMKIRHQKRQAREGAEKCLALKPHLILAVSPEGCTYFVPNIFLEKSLQHFRKKNRQLRQQQCVALQAPVHMALEPTKAVIDMRGVVRYFSTLS